MPRMYKISPLQHRNSLNWEKIEELMKLGFNT